MSPAGPGHAPAAAAEPRTDPPEPVAEIRDAFVGYPSPAGTVMALRGLDLTVHRGERVLVQGPNGSGKSTMLRLLTGEQEATAGRVRVGGTDLDRLGAVDRRRWRVRGVGLVDQHARRALLPEWTVVDNVALQLRLAGVGRSAARRRALQLLDRLELAGLADRRVPTLSGGELQRVAVCAALAHEPFLLLADEPTGELDDAAAAQVCTLLAGAGAATGTALLLVSHDQRAAGLVDRAIRIRDGRLAEQWSPGTGAPEEQVLDGRGWLRLPDGLAAGASSARAEAGASGTITLTRQWSRPPAATVAARFESEAVGVEVAGRPVAGLSAGGPTLVRLAGVRVAFGERLLFDGVELTVRAGDWVTLRGHSGSGKSTLLALAAGLTDPDAGTVEIGGTPVAPLGRADRAALRRRAVAMALQSSYLAEALTVAENLGFARRADSPTAPDARAVAGQLGLARLLDQPVRSLSGGERQRVAIGRTLVSGAPLLILDEPTSQQDQDSARMVAAALEQACAAGRGVLAATHDTALSDRGTVLRLGAAGGPPAQPLRHRAAQPPR